VGTPLYNIFCAAGRHIRRLVWAEQRAQRLAEHQLEQGLQG
jgi:hypothetical protein